MFKSMTSTVLSTWDIVYPICPLNLKRNMIQLLHK